LDATDALRCALHLDRGIGDQQEDCREEHGRGDGDQHPARDLLLAPEIAAGLVQLQFGEVDVFHGEPCAQMEDAVREIFSQER
jgi:hypothetical protein